jgi:hypothetical protein
MTAIMSREEILSNGVDIIDIIGFWSALIRECALNAYSN